MTCLCLAPIAPVEPCCYACKLKLPRETQKALDRAYRQYARGALALSSLKRHQAKIMKGSHEHAD